MDEADIIHLDWEAVETWSREAVVADFEKAFGSMDGDIEEAKVEHTHGFENEVGPCLYLVSTNSCCVRILHRRSALTRI